MAMDAVRLEWTARKEDEVNRVLENASSQLVEQFEEQKQEALEKAIDEARVRTLVERRFCRNNLTSLIVVYRYNVASLSTHNCFHQNEQCRSVSVCRFFPT